MYLSSKAALRLYISGVIGLLIISVLGFAWDISDGHFRDANFDFNQVAFPQLEKPLCSQSFDEDCVKDPLAAVTDILRDDKPVEGEVTAKLPPRF